MHQFSLAEDVKTVELVPQTVLYYYLVQVLEASLFSFIVGLQPKALIHPFIPYSGRDLTMKF